MPDEQVQSGSEEASFEGIENALAFLNTKAESGEPIDDAEPEEEETEEIAASEDNDETLEADSEVDDGEEEEETLEADDAGEEDEDEDEDEEVKFTPFTVGEGDDAITVSSLEEARAGFLKNKDYTVKTTEIKREREKLSEITDGLLSKKSEYIEAIGLLKASTDQNLKEFIGVDWVALEKDDPYEFETKKNAFDAARLQYTQALELEQAQAAEYEAEFQQQSQLLQQRAIDQLVTARPEVAEGDQFEKAVKFMADNYDLSADEIVGTNNPKLWMAMLDLAGKRPARKSKRKTVTMKPKANSVTTKAQRADKKRKDAFDTPGGIDMATAMSQLGISR